jgi:hypothetical protein
MVRFIRMMLSVSEMSLGHTAVQLNCVAAPDSAALFVERCDTLVDRNIARIR